MAKKKNTSAQKGPVNKKAQKCVKNADLTPQELEIVENVENVEADNCQAKEPDPDQAVNKLKLDNSQKADFVEQTDKEHPDNWDEYDWEKLLNPAEFNCLPKTNNKNQTMMGKVTDFEKYNNYIPQRFQNYRTLSKFVDDYFSNCDNGRRKRPYTVPGLAHWLGFNSRRGLLKFSQSNSLCGRVIRSALLRIHAQRNEQLVSGQGQMAGRIADLKNNFGWNDLTPGSEEEKAHKKSLEKKHEEGSTDNQTKDQKHLHLHGMLPPEPKTMEEWSNMYQSYVKGKKKKEVAAKNKENAALKETDENPEKCNVD